MNDIYKTIVVQTQGIYKEKGSKFLSFAMPVHNVDEIKEIVKEYRKQYYDARHVCYAYMLGAERKEWRANDDGEPSGTAGKPILGQINSKELTDVLVIVVRYFGGTLLGTSGLITAYKEATIDALNQAEIIEKTVDVFFEVHFDYPLMNEVMRVVKDTNAQIIGQAYDNDCVMSLSIRKQDAETLRGKLEKVEGVRISDDA
ncbi:YigZ family protein [Paludibacter sp. 221]|uniref:IMPACT family protein n=1 Tax=Paludibacter sp. 221 TaxID=2302939 RepID=UPI0013D15D78|nr:YigZ family protein [Paludibacter sp. 221]NDV45983.1 YigZ family protein [Paludibacter sp. 221]